MKPSYHATVIHSKCGRDVRDCECGPTLNVPPVAEDSTTPTEQWLLQTVQGLVERVEALERNQQARVAS